MQSFERLNNHLKAGRVYRREDLLLFSNSVDRDLNSLLQRGLLEKVGAGLYYKPRLSRFGVLPADNARVVRAFLRDDVFLMFSWSEYNTLGLGLTQLYNQMVVYNKKRHGAFDLANSRYDFRRPARGFPRKLTTAFLLVDLLNNLGELSEDIEEVKEKVKSVLQPPLLRQAKQSAKKYGKISTKKFFDTLE